LALASTCSRSSTSTLAFPTPLPPLYPFLQSFPPLPFPLSLSPLCLDICILQFALRSGEDYPQIPQITQILVRVAPSATANWRLVTRGEAAPGLRLRVPRTPEVRHELPKMIP
jgi:hypothetical protein